VRRNGNASFAIEGKEGVTMTNDITMRSNSAISRTTLSRREREESQMRGSSQQDICPLTPASPPSNSRRRKGIPHRAPFKS